MEDGKGCVLVLCGIPGCGKTTLGRKIKGYIDDTEKSFLHVLHICFDDLIPSNLDLNERVVVMHGGAGSHRDKISARNMETLNSNVDVIDKERDNYSSVSDGSVITSLFSLWKAYRKSILTLISNLLTIFKSGHDVTELVKYEHYLEVEQDSDFKTSFKQCAVDFVAMLTRPDRGCVCCRNTKERQLQASHILLVDDNMYYRSMRYLYFQLARKYSLGFMQVYIDCHVEDALQWNKQRENSVSDETIMTIAKKLECPNPTDYPWERNSLTICAKNSDEQDILNQIVTGIKHAVNNPVPSLSVEDLEQKEKCRKECISNVIHQADKVLRNCIGEKISQAKDQSSKAALQRLAKNLNEARKCFLQELRINRNKADEVLARLSVQSHHLHEASNVWSRTVEPEKSLSNFVTDTGRNESTFRDFAQPSVSINELQFHFEETGHENFQHTVRVLFNEYTNGLFSV